MGVPRRPLENDRISKEVIIQVTGFVDKPLIAQDENLRKFFANDAFFTAFQLGLEETEGKLIYEIINGQLDVPEFRKSLKNIVDDVQSGSI
jgi:hypothetical protein